MCGPNRQIIDTILLKSSKGLQRIISDTRDLTLICDDHKAHYIIQAVKNRSSYDVTVWL